MSKKKTEVEVHAESNKLLDLRAEDLDVSVDFIDDGLYLGNLAAARDTKTLERLKITHILTIDMVPLPRYLLDRPNITFKFVKLNDVPKEDLISNLPITNEFIKQSISKGGIVLVHCYFGVSRSAAIVIAYIMEKYQLCYADALDLVRSKRRFVHPNMGFEAQLKLFGHMGYKLDKDDPRFKQFRLKMAGQKLKQVKILPQQFSDLIKPDPGLTRERPFPIVYRCKKCRRVVAAQENIIPHIPKELKIELAKKGIRPPPSKLTALNCAENGQLLIEKLKSLACEIISSTTHNTSSNTSIEGNVNKNTGFEGSVTSIEGTVNKNTSIEGGVSKNTSIEGTVNKNTSIEGKMNKITSIEEGANENASIEEGVNKNTSIEGTVNKNTSIEGGVSKNTSIEGTVNKNTSIEGKMNKITSIEEGANENASIEEGVNKNTSIEGIVNKNTSIEGNVNTNTSNEAIASGSVEENATTSTSSSDSNGHSQSIEHLDGYSEQNLVDAAIVGRSHSAPCRLMWFVEPMQWMREVAHEPQGKLHCPKCNTKIGSFSWLMGCKCPCGQKVAPAFYLVPSKVEWSNIVQNVQTTV